MINDGNKNEMQKRGIEKVSYWKGTFLTLSSNTTVSFWGDNGAVHAGDTCELYPCNLWHKL